MKVRFYKFAKRVKSTKQVPNNATYLEIECYLKDTCSVLRPVLLLSSFNPESYNYFYIPDWNRYYFIGDVEFIEKMWQVGGVEDYLGSHKSAIGSTSALILYASGASNDLPDTRIPVKATVARSVSSVAFPFTITANSGRIILGITGKGSFGPYALANRSDLNELLDGLDVEIQQWTDIFDYVKQVAYGGNAGQCLKSALEIPLDINMSNYGVIENLYLGGYPCKDSNGNAIRGYKITTPIIHGGTTVTIPWIYNDWRNISSYTDVCLYIPFIGIISLPASELKVGDNTFAVNIGINITSGDIAVEVYGWGTGRIYCTASGNCALNTPYGATGIDTNRATAAITSGIGTLVAIGTAIATEGGSLALHGAVGAGLASTAMNTIAALGGTSTGSGGLGGGASAIMQSQIKCWVVSKQLADDPNNYSSKIGKPYSKVATIGSFSGYVQTDGFQFESSDAYSPEIDKINQFLDSGIYYE